MKSILINMTYAVYTPESIEHGDSAESGFEFINEEYTFAELVELMKEHQQCSCYPISGNTGEWLTGEASQDRTYWEQGEERITSIHYSREQPARNAKYWRKAMIHAGIIA